MSCALVAVTVHDPGSAGAVYVTMFPLPLMLTQEAPQVTLVSLAPVTVVVRSIARASWLVSVDTS